MGFAVGLSGCNQKDTRQPADTHTTQQVGNGHEDHNASEHSTPASFAQGVDELKEHYTEIKSAFSQADRAKAIEVAHEPLHGVGHILDSLPELATNANLSPDDLKVVKDSVATMFNCYMNIDGAIHDKKAPDYDAESDKLDKAMNTIEEVLDRQNN